MTLALGADGGRVRDEMDDMAQTGGFDGYQGLNFTTGEYPYHDDAYVNGIEFWKELYDSGHDAARAPTTSASSTPVPVRLGRGRLLHRRSMAAPAAPKSSSRHSCRRSAAARS